MSATTQPTTETLATVEPHAECAVSWCLSHLVPDDEGLTVGKGWFFDGAKANRFHPREGQFFGLAMFEDVHHGKHSFERHSIDNRGPLDLSLDEARDAVRELNEFIALAERG